MVPAYEYGSGVYDFAFQATSKSTSKKKSFKLRKIPLEIAYRYPDLFTPKALEAEDNYQKLSSKYLFPEFFETLRISWPLFYKEHPSASKQEIIDWANRLFAAYVSELEFPPGT